MKLNDKRIWKKLLFSSDDVLKKMNYSSCINEALRRRAGLEKLYHYEVQKNLTVDGSSCGGVVRHISTYELILLTDGMHDSGVQAVYLHEVAHIICFKNDIHNPEHLIDHCQYFACLVAIMYRRTGLLYCLRIYDFGEFQRPELYEERQNLTDDELIKRFEYVMRRSNYFAPLPLTMEQIAKRIFDEDIFPFYGKSQNDTLPKFDRIINQSA